MDIKKHNRIQKYSGIYKCASCEKMTRETGEGESSVDMCRKCYVVAGQENTHTDCHSGKVRECGKCKQDIEGLGYKIEDIDTWCDRDGEPECSYDDDKKQEKTSCQQI